MSDQDSLMSRAVDAFPLFLLILDTPTKWRYHNQAARDFIGNDRPSGWPAAVHPEDMGTLISTIEQAWTERQPAQCEVRITAANRLHRIIQHTFQPELDSTGAVRMLVGAGVDITDFRQTEMLLADRQRYSAALSLVQKTLLQNLDKAACLHYLKILAAQAFDALEFEIVPLPGAGAKPLTSTAAPEEAALLLQIQAHAELEQSLRSGRSMTVFQDKKQMFFFPAVFAESGAVKVFAVVRQGRVEFGRLETDFLKNLAGLLPYLG